MKKNICVLINSHSGAGSSTEQANQIGALFAAAGTPADVRVVTHAEALEKEIRAAMERSVDVLVAGGGDGTVSSVANAVAGTAVALGVLPLGTLNHFAKDLKLPPDLDAAVALIARGTPSPVDVGEVNGRVFINNSSLGLYPDIVRDRERQQKRLGRGKWPALLWACLAALRRYSFLRVRLLVDGREELWRTPFVFIGNNEYEMAGFAIGERATLNQARLSLYVAQRPGRWRLLQLAVRAFAGRLQQSRDFHVARAEDIVVDSRHHRIRVATDGEVTVMTPPLRYRIRPGALRVIKNASPSAD